MKRRCPIAFGLPALFAVAATLALEGCSGEPPDLVEGPEAAAYAEASFALAGRVYTAAEDARVEQGKPSANYGESTLLRVKSGTSEVRSYLKFHVTGTTRPIHGARVRLFVRKSSANGPRLFAAASTSWSEGTLTWRTQPGPAGAVLDDLASVEAAGEYLEWDVGALVRGEGTYAFVLLADASTALDMDSSEAANPPQLVLDEADHAYRFEASADAYVQQAAPSTNAGAAREIWVDGDSRAARRAYLRFDVAGLAGRIRSARLRVAVTDGTPNGPAVHRSASSSWGEDTITWANQPGPGGAAIANPRSVPGGTFVEWDVTPAITGDGTWSFVLLPESSNGLALRAREDGAPPELLVFTDDAPPPPPPPPPTTCLTPTGLDYTVRVPPAVTLPAAGGSYVDPTYGTTIIRVTDVGGSEHAYPYWPVFNAGNTRFFIRKAGVPTIYSLDPETDAIAELGPLFPDATCDWEGSTWSRTDPRTIFCTARRAKRLYAYDIETRNYSLVKDFSALLTDSTDDEIRQLLADDARDVFSFHTRDRDTGANLKAVVWQRSTDRLWTRRYRASDELDELRVDRSGGWAVLHLYHRLTVWDFRAGTVVDVDRDATERGGCGHHTPASGLYIGEDCWAAGFQTRTLANPERPTHIADYRKADGTPNWTLTSHVSVLQDDERWFLGGIYGAPETYSEWDPWEQELLAVATDGRWVLRLAHHHSFLGDKSTCPSDYWNEPRPSISFDGRWVAFTSNFDGEGCDASRRDVFILKVPPICP